ncbi:MAG: hypothetical protein WCE68_05820 [Anaerolineales bacterium]
MRVVFDTNVLASAVLFEQSTPAGAFFATLERLLELAASGKADAIVTGDSDLLVLHPFRKIAILKPDSFLNVFPPENS